MKNKLTQAAFILLALMGVAYAQLKISQEPAGAALTGTELFLGNQNGGTVTFTANQIKQFVGSATAGVTGLNLSPPAFIGLTSTGTTGNITDTLAWSTENPNTVLAGPTSGAAAGPTFRGLTSADLPNSPSLSGTVTIQNGVVAHGCTMSSGATYVVDAGTVCPGADYIICVNKTTGSASAIDLPASPAPFRVLTVKDCKHDAATNNITLVPSGGALIEGAASLILNINGQSASVWFDGVNWEAS